MCSIYSDKSFQRRDFKFSTISTAKSVLDNVAVARLLGIICSYLMEVDLSSERGAKYLPSRYFKIHEL